MSEHFNELKRLFDAETSGDPRTIVLTFINLLEGKSIFAAKRIFRDAYRKVETVNKVGRTKAFHHPLNPNG